MDSWDNYYKTRRERAALHKEGLFLSFRFIIRRSSSNSSSSSSYNNSGKNSISNYQAQKNHNSKSNNSSNSNSSNSRSNTSAAATTATITSAAAAVSDLFASHPPGDDWPVWPGPPHLAPDLVGAAC